MEILTLTNDNFDEVIGGDTPVLVDFWAVWCGPCRMFAPIVEEFAQEHADKVLVGKVNVDEEPELARRFRVMSIPTAMLFKGGEAAATLVGVQPKEKLEELL